MCRLSIVDYFSSCSNPRRTTGKATHRIYLTPKSPLCLQFTHRQFLYVTSPPPVNGEGVRCQG